MLGNNTNAINEKISLKLLNDVTENEDDISIIIKKLQLR